MRRMLPLTGLLFGLVLAFAFGGSSPAQALSGLGSAVGKPESQLQTVQYRRHIRGHGRVWVGHSRPWRGYRHHRYARGGWYGPRVYFAAPVYSYRHSYRNSCSWMKRRYNQTGSHYWWRRYVQCRS